MDPNATLVALLDAIEERELSDAEDHFRNLLVWLRKGGAAPNAACAAETLRERMRDETV